MDKKSLSERDICTKFITPALRKAGWDEMAQIREEVSFTKGRIIRGGIGDLEVVPKTIEGANLTQDVARIAPRNGIDVEWLRYAL